MRRLYTLLLHLLLPWALLRLFWLGRRQPGYRQDWWQRLGRIAPVPAGAVWLHAVSLGETRAVLPLVAALQRRWPQQPLLLTHGTPTGRWQAAAAGAEVHRRWAPYDLPWAIDAFLDRVQPALLVLVETELWPNWLHACRQRGIPVALINARLSERSLRRYQRAAWLTRPMAAALSWVAARSPQDAGRLAQLGVAGSAVEVVGDLKFDQPLPADVHAEGRRLRAAIGAHRPVWVAASTHPGEDEVVLAAHRSLRRQHPDAVLILAPRHPHRAAAVRALCEASGDAVVLRSQQQPCTPDTAVLLYDTVGELMTAYAAADLAFVGGSLVDVGGHNPLEPAVLGLPVLCGPHRHNFAVTMQALAEVGALRKVHDADSLTAALLDLYAWPEQRQQLGQAGRAWVLAQGGALERTVHGLQRLLAGRTT